MPTLDEAAAPVQRASEPAPTLHAVLQRRVLPRTPFFLLAIGIGLLLVGVFGDVAGNWPAFLVLVPTLALAVFTPLVAGVRVLFGLAALRHERSGADLLCLLGNAIVAGIGMWLAYEIFGTSRGRQLRRFGLVLLPPLDESADWNTAVIVLGSGEAPPLGLADQWRADGRTEHASVAAFARLALDLVAVGAPPRLVADANRDALDEIRHTELCFSLAQALDGRAIGPGPFPAVQHVSPFPYPRPLALARLAVSSLVDGALQEGVSARILAALARRAEDPALRALLKEIAADEGRHAAHGWTVVRWCLQEGGSPVAQALLGALRALPRQMRSTLPPGAQDGGWERWGIHGHGLEAAEYASALDQLTERVHAEVAPLVRAAA